MDRLEQLKAKYKPALDLIPKLHIRLENLHVQDDKLFLKGAAPSQQQVNEFWNGIKSADASYSDLTCQITVDPSIPPVSAPQPQTPPQGQTREYTVVAGDSLWKIAANLMGNGARYPEIIKANPGKLKDEKTVIHPGDVLTIPAS